MALYKKKPVIIEAVRYDGTNLSEIRKFTEGMLALNELGQPLIPTFEGDMKISIGDYVIKGVHGEFYPCKPDIFLETYEAV